MSLFSVLSAVCFLAFTFPRLPYDLRSRRHASSAAREQQNWLIQQLYSRNEHAECLTLIDRKLTECNGQCDFALYIKGTTVRHGVLHFQQYVIIDGMGDLKALSRLRVCTGLIRRQQGAVQESLQLFQSAAALNPLNLNNLKQVGRSLYACLVMHS